MCTARLENWALTATPGTTLDIDDPGDDVQLRFRYQHAFTAIHCARLLVPECEYDTIYCENLEDALLRKKNGRFVGIQVKTRAFHLEPFKAGDTAVKKSIGRFANLEARFPGQFDGYRFVTNHGFWAEKDNQHCLDFLIRTLKARGGVKRLRSTHELRAWIAQICADHGCKEYDVVSAVLKLDLVGHESDLERSSRDLQQIVAELDGLEDCSAKVAGTIADNLMHKVYKASSVVLGGGKAALYELVADFNAHRDALVLLGKTIQAADVRAVISSVLTGDLSNLLVSANLVPADALPDGVAVLEEKLTQGGLQQERINKVKDFKASMEDLYLSWLYKQDLKVANDRMAHLKVLVEDDCIEAKLETLELKTVDYAPEMYGRLRERLNIRAASTHHSLFGATPEHLVGTAAILTEECSVWWSDKFDLKSKKP